MQKNSEGILYQAELPIERYGCAVLPCIGQTVISVADCKAFTHSLHKAYNYKCKEI